MTEKRPIISAGGGPRLEGAARKTLPMPVRYAINAVVVLVLLVLGELMIDGGVVNRYQSTVLEQVGIYIILAVSLNIATGYLGQLPLGHAGFMSMGAYGCSIFIIRMSEALGVGARDFVTGTPLALALVLGGLVVGGICAAIAGIIIGIPALRLKGDYLAIITLAFAEIIRVVMLNIDDVVGFDLTGGAAGLTGIPGYSSFLLGLWLRGGGVLPHPHDDEVPSRPRHPRHPRQRDRGRGHRRQHHLLQDARLRCLRVLRGRRWWSLCRVRRRSSARRLRLHEVHRDPRHGGSRRHGIDARLGALPPPSSRSCPRRCARSPSTA